MNVPLNIDWQQILLHLFNFVILFAVLYFLLYNPVKKFMDGRTAYYKDLENSAKENFENSEKVKEEYLNKLTAADAEVEEIKRKARKELEEANQSKIKKAEEEAAKIISDARLAIDREHAKMIKEAQGEISDMVACAAEKLVINSTTSEAYDSFLNASKRGETDE